MEIPPSHSDKDSKAPVKLFAGRRVGIATTHGKELVLAPALSRLGMRPHLVRINTDQFGTFSGERLRKGSALEACEAKCLHGIASSGLDLVLASEGSFGPHPVIPFASANEELLLLFDAKNNHRIAVRVLSTQTNYGSTTVLSEKELLEFAGKVGFPRHALILRSTVNQDDGVKGIDQESMLLHIFRQLSNNGRQPVRVDTDMRAMFNPTRMSVIKECAGKLDSRLRCHCPNCLYPGYGRTGEIIGLPCSFCGSPTQSVLREIWGCSMCNFQEEKTRTDGRAAEEPMFCPFCNP
jgi:hypothetical protein